MNRQPFNSIIYAKMKAKSLNMHYDNLNRIKNSRNKKLSISINAIKTNFKKQMLQEQKLGQIEKNNMLLFTKISSIYNRDSFNKMTKHTPKKHHKRQLAFSQIKIEQQNKSFYHRLCQLKPTINNQKILQQRKKELSNLKYIGRHSDHNLQSNKPSSFRIHSNRQVFSQTSYKMKTQGNLNNSEQVNYESQAYMPTEKQKSKRKEKALELRYTSQNFHNQINSDINLTSKRYLHEKTENFRKLLLTKSKNSPNKRSSLSKSEFPENFAQQLIVHTCSKKLNNKLYNIKVVRKQNFYEIICSRSQQISQKLILKIKQQSCNEMLSLLDYNYQHFLSFLKLKYNKLSLSFNSYRSIKKNNNQTIFSHISEGNQDQSIQPKLTESIQPPQAAQNQEKTSNYYNDMQSKSPYYQKVQNNFMPSS